MATVYERILELCQQKGVTPGKMCNDLGYSRNTMTALKTGRSTTLKLDKAQRIADYFGVSVDTLLGNEQREKPLVNGDEELTEYLEILKTRPEMRMLFSLTKNATKEDVEKAVRIVEAALGK